MRTGAPPSAGCSATTSNTSAVAYTPRAERGGLLGCLDHVTAAGQQARMAGLTAGAGALLACDGPWADAVVRQGGAIQAARKAAGQAAEAGTPLRQALPILQRLGAPEATDVATELDALTSVPPAP